jgi:thiopurine S-methyltransferase
VLVPLCGKSLDMLWLAGQGHPVVGVELDRGAVEAFFKEAGLVPRIDETGPLPSYSAGGVTVFAGDFFQFDPPGRYGLVYDRAALIALPPEMRPRYLAHLAALLAPEAKGLLITLEYSQPCMQGPPFSVMPEELVNNGTDNRRDNAAIDFQCLTRSDELAGHPRFAAKGLDWLNEATYALSLR